MLNDTFKYPCKFIDELDLIWENTSNFVQQTLGQRQCEIVMTNLSLYWFNYTCSIMWFFCILEPTLLADKVSESSLISLPLDICSCLSHPPCVNHIWWMGHVSFEESIKCSMSIVTWSSESLESHWMKKNRRVGPPIYLYPMTLFPWEHHVVAILIEQQDIFSPASMVPYCKCLIYSLIEAWRVSSISSSCTSIKRNQKEKSLLLCVFFCFLISDF